MVLCGSRFLCPDLLGWRSYSLEDGHLSLGTGLQPVWQQRTLRRHNK